MVTLDSLKYRHEEYRNNKDYWILLDAALEGGDKITDSIKRQLLPNPDGRPEAVVSERIKLATYINKISPILNRFNSELFSKPGVFTGSLDPWWKEKFFTMGALLNDDDDSRANFNNFLQRSMHNALATGKAIAQIDTRISAYPTNKGTQQQLGELDPYIILHPRTALWDWDGSLEGFNFTKIQQFRVVRDSWDSLPIPEHVFTIYFRDNSRVLASKYRVRLRKVDKNTQPVPFIDTVKEEHINIFTELEAQEVFNIDGKYIFPVVTLTLPTNLWIGAQLMELQKSFFRQTAAIDYALYTGNYGIIVVSGVEDETDDPLTNRNVGDGYYLCLKEGQNISWLERSGGSVTTALSYRSELKRDIYDTLQQIAMSAADGVSILSRSGESKKEDRRPEEILLLKYGELVKEFAKNILDCASIARGEGTDWKVEGYDDFITAGLTDVIADVSGISTTTVNSPTFKKEVQKYLIKEAGKSMDISPDAIQKSLNEVDAYVPLEIPIEENVSTSGININ